MKILLAVDGSDDSLAAVRHVLAQLGAGLRAELVLANVQEPASLYELLRVHDAEAIEAIARGAGEHSLQEAAALCSAAGANFEQEVASGEPAHTLLDIAEEQGCAQIVLGVRGKGGTGGTRLGSVAHALLHDSVLPVTLVQAGEAGAEPPAGD